MDIGGAEMIRFGSGVDAALYLPEGQSPRPAVVFLHERYGLAQHTLDLARRIAEAGFVGLAPDLFSHWQGDREQLRRGEVRVTVPDDEVAAVIEESLDALRSHPRVEPQNIALAGVCQSGRYAVDVASRRTDLAACVVLYGAAQATDWEVNALQPRPLAAMLRGIQPPCLFIFGEGDHIISLEDVARVRTALEEGRRSYRMRVFPNVPHGWLNDTMPGRYRPAEAAEAWNMLLELLRQTFAREWPPEGRVRWEFESEVSPGYDFSRNVRYE